MRAGINNSSPPSLFDSSSCPSTLFPCSSSRPLSEVLSRTWVVAFVGHHLVVSSISPVKDGPTIVFSLEVQSVERRRSAQAQCLSSFPAPRPLLQHLPLLWPP